MHKLSFVVSKKVNELPDLIDTGPDFALHMDGHHKFRRYVYLFY